MIRTRQWRWLWAVLTPVLLPAMAQAGFRNTVNRPFASRCNGPQGAVVVARQKGVMMTAASAKRRALNAQHSPVRLQAAAASYARLQRMKLKPRHGEVRFPRTIVHTLDGKLVQPDLMQTQAAGAKIGEPGNNLTFAYEGFSNSDKAALQSYLATAYPKAKLIYGPPAFNMTVKIIQDNTIAAIQGGTYDAAANEIRIPPLSGNFPEDTYVLLMLVLNAFHDDAMLFYDAWEQGMAGAAAYAVQLSPGVSPGYDIIDPGPFYCLSVYESENQPELGNSTFYPASGATNMLVWRIAMARAAWQKCWIENNNFFSAFNQAYYASYNNTLPGDVPALKELAAGALPVVEDTPFAEWYEHQYALDTSVRTGQKLYTWNIPLPQSVALVCELYETLADGDERPFGGQARTIYWNYQKQIQLYAEEGNLIDIPPGGTTPGEGFLLPTFFNIGGAQRVTVQVDVAGLRRNYIYPYGERGFELSENNLYGAIIGPTSGTLNVEGGNGLTDLTVDRGVWGDRITTAMLSPQKLTVSFATTAGKVFTRRVNIGWDSYVCFLEAGDQATLSHQFAYDLNGLHLMSLPLQPQTSNLSATLGIPANELLVAWWDPNYAGESKYRLWPSFPLQGLGSAYWLRVLSDVTATLTGLQADPAEDLAVTVGGGWNLLGCPRPTDVLLEDLMVQQGESEPVPWADAVTQRLVQGGLYSYRQAAGYELQEMLQPWRGYWLRCLVPNGVTLIFPAEGVVAGASLKTRSAKPRAAGWRLPLVVQAGPYRSASAALGMAPQASEGADEFDLSAPPGFGPRVEARFVHGDWGRQSGQYCTDIRPANQPRQTWEVQVTTTVPNQSVRVSWPDLSSVPAAVKPVLYDPLTGTRQYLRTTTAHTLPAGQEGVSRKLIIETAGDAASLALTGLCAQTAAQGVALTYSLSSAAEVTARVMNLAGRPVRVLQQGRLQPAGSNSLLWDLSDQTGKKIPAGVYLVELVATGDTGQQVRALRSVGVQR